MSNCDAVFDTVGGDVAQRCFAVLKPGGRAAFIASGAQAPQAARGDVTSLRPPVRRARGFLERIAQLVLRGAVRPPEIKLYRLSQAAEAHRVSESRHCAESAARVVAHAAGEAPSWIGGPSFFGGQGA